MKTNTFSSINTNDVLDIAGMSSIRGGKSRGTRIPIDEDILIPDLVQQ